MIKSLVTPVTTPNSHFKGFTCTHKENPQQYQIYLTSYQICHKLWIKLKKNCIIFGPTINKFSFNIVIDSMKQELMDLLFIENLPELFNIFDKDGDSLLNEDEQILLFTVIKEKIYQASIKLLKSEQYRLQAKILEQVRKIELLICEIQNYFRQKIYQHQLNQYQEIGCGETKQLIKKYQDIYQKFEKKKQKAFSDLVDNQEKREDEFERNIYQQASQKFKQIPKAYIKEINAQQKLFALYERPKEAQEMKRRENEYNEKEYQRLQNEKIKYIEYAKIQFKKKQQKEREDQKLK